MLDTQICNVKMSKEQCKKECKEECKEQGLKQCKKQCKKQCEINPSNDNDMECELTTPKTFDGNTPATSTDFWQYSEMVCTSSEVALVENETTGAEFYIRKSISYGDVIVITFLMIFLIFGIMKFLFDFLIPKMMNFKNK